MYFIAKMCYSDRKPQKVIDSKIWFSVSQLFKFIDERRGGGGLKRVKHLEIFYANDTLVPVLRLRSVDLPFTGLICEWFFWKDWWFQIASM
jgi:hypothetical protein